LAGSRRLLGEIHNALDYCITTGDADQRRDADTQLPYHVRLYTWRSE
jgi:hypothetical protein